MSHFDLDSPTRAFCFFKVATVKYFCMKKSQLCYSLNIPEIIDVSSCTLLW